MPSLIMLKPATWECADIVGDVTRVHTFIVPQRARPLKPVDI